MGAPNANSGQPGVERAGAVYKCDPETPGSCEIIPFDTRGNTFITSSSMRHVDEKSHQWFGSLVTSSGEDGVILACAPRYTYFSIYKRRRDGYFKKSSWKLAS